MVKLISLQDLTKETKIKILKELGYDSDGEYVIKDRQRFKDKYLGLDIKLDNMVILPGSALVLDDNPLSLVSYVNEYGDIF